MNKETEKLAVQFLEAYYTTLMQNRAGLINFYTDMSQMTYNGDFFCGLKQISEKIESFGFQKIQFEIDTKVVQDGPIQNSILVFVTGSLNMDDTNLFKYSQVFNLCPNGQGGFYCHNDIFSLVM
jgi:hypothetical protein